MLPKVWKRTHIGPLFDRIMAQTGLYGAPRKASMSLNFVHRRKLQDFNVLRRKTEPLACEAGEIGRSSAFEFSLQNRKMRLGLDRIDHDHVAGLEVGGR